MGIQSSMSTRSAVPNRRRNADGMSSHGIWHIRNLRKHQQSHKDTVNFEELQGMAKRCRGAPEDSEREEMHWLGRLQGSDYRIEKSRSSSSSDDSNSVSVAEITRVGPHDYGGSQSARDGISYSGSISFHPSMRKTTSEILPEGDSGAKRLRLE
jgi:hypothetical protein